MANRTLNPVKRILQILAYEKKDISSIYFFAAFSGLVQLSLPLGIQSIIGLVMGGSLSTSLMVLIIGVVLGVFLQGWLQVIQLQIIERIQQQLFVRYSFLYAYSLPRINLREVDAYYLPEQVNRFFDVVSLQKGLSKLLIDIPTASIQILFGLLLLSFYHPVFIFFGISLILLLVFILYRTGTRGLSTSLEESNYKYKVAGWLEELARAVTSFKFSKNSSLHLYKTDAQMSGYLGARTAHFRILQIQYWSLIVFKVIITAAMLVVGSLLLLRQQLNIGQFIAAEIVILMVLSAAEKLIGNLEKVYDVLTSVDKLSKLIDNPQEESGQLSFQRTPGRGIKLSVQNLRFGYQNDQQVLSDVSLEAGPGEKICIMGSQGSGKSTLLRVLTGAYRPYQGVITVDEIPLSNYDSDSLRAQTGVLLSSQDIFEGTLLENISMGKPSIEPARVMTMAGKLGLADFIRQNPEGLLLPLHPAGNRLPGRIIHRILLLRATISSPGLLLLEEPWQGQDEETAQAIRQFLLEEFPGSTVLVSTNDLAFARGCDRIVLIENGQTVWSGNWQEYQTLNK